MRVVRWTLATGMAAALAGCTSDSVLVNGAGATFPYPIYAKWFSEYNKIRPEVKINYQSIGSGGGIRQLLRGTVDFGASDSPMTEEQMEKAPTGVRHFPTVIGAVVPVYNLEGVGKGLNFSTEAMAGIFLGTVNRWDDPALTEANPGVKLPAENIVVVHRSDGSGTTFVFTDYLSKVSQEWKTRVGASTSVSWPAGVGAKGNEGVAGLVQQAPNTVGYVELVFALQNEMPYGRVANQAGRMILPELTSVTAAAASVEMPDDFRVSITNAEGEDAYPISSFTWLLIPNAIENEVKREALTSFLRWMVGDGQVFASDMGYAPLPESVRSRELAVIDQLH